MRDWPRCSVTGISDYRGYLASLGLSSPMALEGFLEAAPDAIVVVDWSGDIVIVNQLAERLFGYSRQELLGMPIERLVPQRFREQHAGRRNDGSEFTVEISLSPLKTETGTLVISIIRDTTARKKVEERFRGFLEAAPDAIVVVDREGRMVILNTQAERLFKYARGPPGSASRDVGARALSESPRRPPRKVFRRPAGATNGIRLGALRSAQRWQRVPG
jgi:PAS domain-containing protein